MDVGGEGGGGGVGGGGFGHALEACKNFLCTAVSGGSRGRAVGVWAVGAVGAGWG